MLNATDNFIDKVYDLALKPLYLLLVGVALLVFFWGVFEFIKASSSGGKILEDGKQHMIWGVVGLAIMVSIGGIIAFINNTLEPLPNDSDRNDIVDDLPYDRRQL